MNDRPIARAAITAPSATPRVIRPRNVPAMAPPPVCHPIWSHECLLSRNPTNHVASRNASAWPPELAASHHADVVGTGFNAFRTYAAPIATTKNTAIQPRAIPSRLARSIRGAREQRE